MEIGIGKKSVYLKKDLITPKGEITGFSCIFKPSTKFVKTGKYSVSILLSKEDGEKLLEIAQEVRKEQFKNFKGKKLAEIKSIKPYTKLNEETGEETPDSEGRYILSAGLKAERGKVAVFDAKGKPVSKALNIGEGTTVKLKLGVSGYTVAETGVSFTLKAVQIIDFVEYVSSSVSFEGFEAEEGFDIDDIKEEIKVEEDLDTVEEPQEADDEADF
ncbi:MAG: DUF2815 family protein [Candidatus Gastranaerophilales bacterium]|nr:DUF2815 family protein [Candidatus Gastranaerophilales bacterium]